MILMHGKFVNHLSDTESGFHCGTETVCRDCVVWGGGEAEFRSVRENHRTKMVPLVLKPMEPRL